MSMAWKTLSIIRRMLLGHFGFGSCQRDASPLFKAMPRGGQYDLAMGSGTVLYGAATWDRIWLSSW